VDNWFNKNYEKLKTICRSITKENDVDELLHFCIDIVITNDKFNKIEDEKGKIFYFTRIVLNNWKSISSPYYMTYRRKYTSTNDYEVQTPEIELDEEVEIDLEWVRNELETLKRNEWYYGRLFELYVEEGCSLTKLNKRTTISLPTLSRDINRVRGILKDKRKKDTDGL
jgi:hypothetical protein